MAVAARRRDEHEHRRWRQMCHIAVRLATQQGRRVLLVPSAQRWLDQHARLFGDELALTWTVADAAILRYVLDLDADRVFVAAPRVRYAHTGTIPHPRRHSDS